MDVTSGDFAVLSSISRKEFVVIASVSAESVLLAFPRLVVSRVVTRNIILKRTF